MAGLDNLIGSHLSLISQQDVRYDGVLYSINAKESSIVLRDVKCFGSEDRIKEEYKKIPPNPQILSFVTFPGHEIKDLSVFESSDAKDTATVVTEENKPKAENKTSQPNTRQGESRASKPQSQQNNNRPTFQANNNRENSHHNQNNQNQAVRQNREQNTNREPRVFDKPKSNAGTGEHLAKLRLKKGADGTADPESSEEIKKEFDFEAGLSTFNKTEVLATVASETAASTEPKYVKDDFFDTLTNDTQEKRAARGPHDERTLNQDTFGAIAVQQNYHHRNNGGYRGRGGSNNSNGGRNSGGNNGYNGNGRGGRGGRGGSYRRYNNNNASEVPAT